MHLSWIGHSTVLVETAGARILTDPLLRNRVAHLRRIQPAVPVPRDIDAVLVSHAHYDHLDIPSLRRLSPTPRVVVPSGVGKTLRSRGFADVVEVSPGEEVEVGEATVRATPAEHAPVRRGATRSAALGYLLQGSGNVYFAGDTDLFAEMAELPPIDVALLPVWGWGPRLGAGHLDPQRGREPDASPPATRGPDPLGDVPSRLSAAQLVPDRARAPLPRGGGESGAERRGAHLDSRPVALYLGRVGGRRISRLSSLRYQ